MSAGSAGRDKTWTVLELLTWTTDYFKRAGIEGARLDAEVLLAHALETERLRLYIDYEKPVLPAERDAFRELVRRRAQERVPVSLLLGEREFWSLAFKVSGDVLTPRPETETLVEFALSKLSGGPAGQTASREPAAAIASHTGLLTSWIRLLRPRYDRGVGPRASIRRARGPRSRVPGALAGTA